jgi:flagella basal body P-ring formation protein FlgA
MTIGNATGMQSNYTMTRPVLHRAAATAPVGMPMSTNAAMMSTSSQPTSAQMLVSPYSRLTPLNSVVTSQPLTAPATTPATTAAGAVSQTAANAASTVSSFQSLLNSIIPVIAIAFLLFTAQPGYAAWETPNVPTNNLSTNSAIPQTTGITTTVSTAYFRITQEDVGKAVAEQLQLQAVEQKAEVSLAIGTPGIIYSADHPLKVVIHSLQVDTQAKRWQAQAYILAGGTTETVRPVSGTYMAVIDVPVVTRQLGHSDVIEAKDLSTKSFPERQLRKDTITDPKQLIGQSPHSTITPDRPIRLTEISSPVLIKKGSPVQLTFTNPYMSLKTTGTSLQDGAIGDMIRVKNDKSEKAVSGRVTGSGTVEVNTVEATIAPTAAPAPAPTPAPATHATPPTTTPFQPANQ